MERSDPRSRTPYPAQREPTKCHRRGPWSHIPGRRALRTVTADVEGTLARSGTPEGLSLVDAMHITASVLVSDDEPGLHRDLERRLEERVPHAPTSPHDHDRTRVDGGDAQLEHRRMGREVVVAATDGGLDPGPREPCLHGESDGGRRKRVRVMLIGE